jgi:DNA-binding response OmpR family regulator
MTRILIIEDDISILRGLEDNLRFEGYEVLGFIDGQEGLDQALNEIPDLLLLDIMLPGLNGYEVCRRLKTRHPNLPIIMLTARGAEVDKIAGLDQGADDYVTKPFSLPELLARIRAVLRRSSVKTGVSSVYRYGNVSLDFKKYQAFVNQREVTVSSREFAIMQYLIEHAGEVVHRHDLLDQVWGYTAEPTTRTVDNYILSLRKKLEEHPADPEHIVSVRGVGYKFIP